MILALADIGGDLRVTELCAMAASPAGRQVFDSVVIVDSLGDGRVRDWITEQGLGDFVTYENSAENLGSAGNLARRLEICAGRDADYLFALNQDGDLRLSVVRTLISRAAGGAFGAIYPLSSLAPDIYDLTGTRPFPTRPIRRRCAELPARGSIEVFWSCSNGALYSLEPARRGLEPPPGLWHGYEDLAYGLLLERAGYRQVIELGARIEMRYEMRPVEVLSQPRLISDKEPWLTYYFARNLLLIALWYVPHPGHFAKAVARIALELATITFFRDRKLRRMGLLARGALAGLCRRTGKVVRPPEAAVSSS